MISKQSTTEVTNPVEENHAVTANSHNWYYGTEELLDALPRRWTRSLLYFLVIFSAIALLGRCYHKLMKQEALEVVLNH